jgi:hypothetical protein
VGVLVRVALRGATQRIGIRETLLNCLTDGPVDLRRVGTGGCGVDN